MPDAYNTTDPVVRAQLVQGIILEQEEIDQWRAVPAGSRIVSLAPIGIEAAHAVIAKFMGLLADGGR